MSTIIGTGIDIESIQRFRDKPFAENEKFYRRLFTPSEVNYCTAKKDPYPHFTARYCAKESLRKAVPKSIFIGWHDAEVRNDADGKPSINFPAPSRDIKTVLYGCTVHISLSHDEVHAIAYVIVERA